MGALPVADAVGDKAEVSLEPRRKTKGQQAHMLMLRSLPSMAALRAGSSVAESMV